MIKLIGFHKTLNEGISQQTGKPYRFNSLHLYVEHDQNLPDGFEGKKASYMQIDLDGCVVEGEAIPGCDVCFEYSLGREAKVCKVIFY